MRAMTSRSGAIGGAGRAEVVGDDGRLAPSPRRPPAASLIAGYGTPSVRWTAILLGSVGQVERVGQQPLEVRHVRARRDRPRVLEVAQVPDVGILAPDAGQVRAVSLRAPLERMVVDRLPEARVVPVAQHVRHEGADHLRMAEVAAVAHIEVAAGELEGRVGDLAPVLHVRRPGCATMVGMIWMRPPGDDGDQRQDREGQRGDEKTVIPRRPPLPARPRSGRGHRDAEHRPDHPGDRQEVAAEHPRAGEGEGEERRRATGGLNDRAERGRAPGPRRRRAR